MRRVLLITAALALLVSACQPGLYTPTPVPLTATSPPPPMSTQSPLPTTTQPPSPTATQPPPPTTTPTPTPFPAITVTSPRAGETISSPVRVTGQATVFEGTVQLRLKDAYGKVIGRGFVQATSAAPERGDYAVDFFYAAPATAQDGVLEVYEESAKDGSELHMVGVKVRLAADDTPSDWETYENKVYGWVVRYPANWYVNQGEFAPPPPVTIKFSTYQVVTGTTAPTGTNHAEVWIAVSDDPIAVVEEMKYLEGQGYTWRQVALHGVYGDRLIAPQSQPGLYDVVYLTRNVQPIRIHLSAATHDFDRTFEQMLGTFAFGEPTAGEPTPQSITVYQADQGKELLSDDQGFPEINAAFLKLAAGLDVATLTAYTDTQVTELFSQTNRVLLAYSPATTITTGMGDRLTTKVIIVNTADILGCQVLFRGPDDAPVWGVHGTTQRQLFLDFARVVKEQTGVELVPDTGSVAAPQRITVYQVDQGKDLSPGDTGFDEIVQAFAQLAGGLDTTVRTIYNDEQVEQYFGKANRVLLIYTPVAWLPFGDTDNLEVSVDPKFTLPGVPHQFRCRKPRHTRAQSRGGGKRTSAAVESAGCQSAWDRAVV